MTDTLTPASETPEASTASPADVFAGACASFTKSEIDLTSFHEVASTIHGATRSAGTTAALLAAAQSGGDVVALVEALDSVPSSGGKVSSRIARLSPESVDVLRATVSDRIMSALQADDIGAPEGADPVLVSEWVASLTKRVLSTISDAPTGTRTSVAGSVASMVEDEILYVGQTLYGRKGAVAIVSASGLGVDGIVHKTPSAAARAASGAKSSNGWGFWFDAPVGTEGRATLGSLRPEGDEDGGDEDE